jgi:Spy/CpxP family protein refolding chaperone
MQRVLITAALLLSSTTAFAFGPPPHMEPGERLEQALDEVDATDEQRTTLRVLLEDTLPALKGFREEGKALHERMNNAFRAETVDRLVVEDVRLDALDLADRASETVLNMVVAGANVLTQDQRVFLADKHEEMREKHHQMHDGLRAQ